MLMLSISNLGEGYPFRVTQTRPSAKGGLLLCVYTYTFRTRLRRTYIVEVERYKHDIFILKFYLKIHRGSPKKFNLMTKSVRNDERYDGDAWRILTTCLRIMLRIRKEFPQMSGGFIGAALADESKVCTKRFRVWGEAALAFFSPDKYIHHNNPQESAYFIECKDSPTPNILNEAGRMFNKLYRGIETMFGEASQASDSR